jgi:thiol-disulfide isomerase/thioredoxin
MKVATITLDMSRPTFLLLAVLTFFGCQQQVNQNQSTNITIIGAPSAMVSLLDQQLIGKHQLIKPSESGEKETTYTFDSLDQHYLRLSSPIPLNLIISSGDELTIDLSGDEPVFLGKGSEKSQLVYAFDRMTKDILEPYGDPNQWIESMDENAYLARINEIQMTLQSTADSLLKSHNNKSQWVEEWVFQTITFRVAKYIESYTLSTVETKFSLLESKLESLLPLDPSILNYPSLANQWAFTLTQLHILLPQFQKGEFDISGDTIITNTLEYEQDINMKQIMLAAALESELKSFDVSLTEKYKSEIDQTLQIATLSNSINQLYDEAKRYLASNANYTEGGYVGDYDVNEALDQILLENKGKVIYMDIWATWCKPCLEEFKVSDEFKSNFDPKKISYLYVGARSPESAWRAIANKYKLHGTHLLLNEEQFNEFTERYPIGFFPSYYIIDQRGNTTGDKAYLSPSQPQTITEISGLLSK